MELLRPQCKHAGIGLAWKPSAADAVVSGDAGQLGQLILNVLGNAVEAAGPGGDVEVRLQDGATCVLEVSDSGPGPPPEVAERLFEPFVTGKPEGVGLGLAVARQLRDGTPLATVPFVLLTPSAVEDRAAEQAGIAAQLPTPICPRQLYETLA